MTDIIINTTNIKVYEAIFELAKVYNRSDDEAQLLWEELLNSDEFMYEFVYYLEHGELNDKMQKYGFALSDIYVYQIGHYNLFISDIGKNYASCNKDAIVFDTFITMARLIKEPDSIIEKLSADLGNDIH